MYITYNGVNYPCQCRLSDTCPCEGVSENE